MGRKSWKGMNAEEINLELIRLKNNIKARLPDGYLFAILVIGEPEEPMGWYTSNIQRQSAVAALREMCDRIEGRPKTTKITDAMIKTEQLLCAVALKKEEEDQSK